MTNLPEWIYTYFAALRLGATVVPISTWLKEDEVRFVLRKAKVQHLVLMDRFRKIDFGALLRAICPEWAPSTPGELHSTELPDLRNVVVHARSGAPVPAAAYSLHDLLDHASEPLRAAADGLAGNVRPHDLALIKFTSGSTGSPKGVLLEHWGIVTNGRLHSRRLGLTHEDKWFSAMPFFHAGGSVWGLMEPVVVGATLVFTEAFDASAAVELMDREQCTFNFGVGPMIRDEVDVLKARGQTLSSLRMCHGGNAGDAALAADIERWIRPQALFHPYGLTEAYGPDAVISPTDPAEKQSTQGRFLDGIEYRVVDPTSRADVGSGVVGECLIRGLVMRGYYDEPELTARVIDGDGWLHTQDLISVDSDGYVTFLGRIKAMLKVGGENVAVEEVENCIRAFPGVAECCVIGIPDARKQELLRAYVVPAASASGVDAGSLHAWCTARLARYKVPADFVIVPSLPMTGSSKVDRAAVIRADPDAGALVHRQA